MSSITTQFFTKTSSAWEAMLQDIDAATQTIDLEQYIFTIDEIGRKFIDRLCAKAKVGVKIRLLCDAVGSWGLYQSTIPDELKNFTSIPSFLNSSGIVD